MTLRAGVLAVFGFVLAFGAWANPPQNSLRPPPRPVPVATLSSLTPAPVSATPERETVAPPAVAPHLGPKARPGSGAALILPADGPPLPRQRPEPRPAKAQRPAVIVQVAARSRSLPLTATVRPPARPENLRRLSQAIAYRTQPVPEVTTGRKGSVCNDPDIRGAMIPPIAAAVQGCGLQDGVKVTAVSGMALSTPVMVDCTTARALKTWVDSGVKPAVGKLGGGAVRLQIAASYVCRPRNNQKGARVSEHGRGRAIDVSAIVLANGTPISVLKGWGGGQHGKILKKMRGVACGPFNTVLGPGSDTYHRDHFHLDTAQGRGPYCR